MPYCEWITLPDGTRAFVRFALKRPVYPCSACGRTPARLLCDYELAEGRTCDASLCDRCAVTRPVFGKGRIDWCPTHPVPA